MNDVKFRLRNALKHIGLFWYVHDEHNARHSKLNMLRELLGGTYQGSLPTMNFLNYIFLCVAVISTS